MGQYNGNPKPKHGSAELLLQRTEQLRPWLKKLAALFRVELGPKAIEAYLEVLVAYPSEALNVACQRVMREWNEASKFPPPAFFIERIEEALTVEPRISDSRHILDRGDKPPDWEQLQPGELEAWRKEAMDRAEEFQRKLAEAETKLKVIPPVTIDPERAAELDRRRRLQIEEFRKKNNLTGEV